MRGRKSSTPSGLSWNGNEVWLITAGGVTFAAFPTVYAVLFSAFLHTSHVILFALIVRAVSIEFRSGSRTCGGEGSPMQGSLWEASCPPSSSAWPFANIFKGIPIDGSGVFQGNLLTLLNPYGLAGGLFFLLLFVTHGLLWLATRTGGVVQDRALSSARASGFPLRLWRSSFSYHRGLHDPLDELRDRALLARHPLAAVGPALHGDSLLRRNLPRSLTASFILVAGSVLFGVVGLYPNMLPSTLDPAFGLTVHNSASSPLALH